MGPADGPCMHCAGQHDSSICGLNNVVELTDAFRAAEQQLEMFVATETSHRIRDVAERAERYRERLFILEMLEEIQQEYETDLTHVIRMIAEGAHRYDDPND